MRRRALVRGLMAAAVGVGGLAAGALAATSPPGFFDGLRLVRHDGQPFSAATVAGRTVLLNFAFTGCSTTCPMALRQLEELRARLAARGADGIELLTVSADPLGDTPRTLRAFAERQGLRLAHWQLLTGEPSSVFTLMERISGSRGKAGDPLAHPTAFYMLDAHGRLMTRFNGVDADLSRIERELVNLDRTLGVEARRKPAA